MAMTPYSGDVEVISKLGTTPQERGLTTEQFKAKFDEGLKKYVEWFNGTHKSELESELDILESAISEPEYTEPVEVEAASIITFDNLDAESQISELVIKGNTVDGVSTLNARIKSCGKNLFDVSKIQYYGNGQGYAYESNKKLFVKRVYSGGHEGAYLKIKVKPNIPYTFQCKIENLEGTINIGFAENGYNDTDKTFYGLDPLKYQTGYKNSTGYYTMTFIPSTDAIWFSTRFGTGNNSAVLSDIQLEEGSVATEYESYVGTEAYFDGELRRLPNGTYDELSVTNGTRTQRIGKKENVASGTVINYSDMATGAQFVAYAADGTTQVGIKGDTLTKTAVTLIYQLAKVITTPVCPQLLTAIPGGHLIIECEGPAPDLTYRLTKNLKAQVDTTAKVFAALSYAELEALQIDTSGLMPKSGGTFTGIAKAYNNTDYTTAQVRNIILSPDEADAELMGNGDIWIQYEEGEE